MYSRSWASFSAQEVSRVIRSWAKPVIAGPNDQPLPVLRDLDAELLEEGRPDRARADDAHVAAQHVPQLRDLVEVQEPQHVAEPGRLVRGLGGQRLAVVLADATLGAVTQGAELVHRVDVAAPADAAAAVEDWARGT